MSETHDHKPDVRPHLVEPVPASFTKGSRWYVFYSEPARERLAGYEITKDTGLQVFIPLERKRMVRGGRRIEVEYALFPGYGFVQFDINLDTWGGIKGCRGVVDLLRSDRIPRPVPDRVVDGLRVAQSAGVFDRTKPPTVGMPVEITEGPFAGFIGKISRARSSERMDVLVDFLGKAITATVPLAKLKGAN